jgi:hypothetical protein
MVVRRLFGPGMELCMRMINEVFGMEIIEEVVKFVGEEMRSFGEVCEENRK